MDWKITTAGLVLTTLVGTSLTVDHVATARDTTARQADAAADARDLNVGRVLPRTPVNALRTFVSLVAQQAPEQACVGLDEHAAAQLATQHGAPDCPAAARLIRARVSAVNDWIEFEWTQNDQRTHPDGTATMDGCAVTFPDTRGSRRTADPGPRIGRLTLRQIGGGGYLITRIDPCPTAPASSSPSSSSMPTTPPPDTPAAPATPARPGLLPVYPPAIPAMLADRIADNSTAVCAYFTATGRAELAAATHAPDCEAAITALHARVTDARHYANPDITPARTTPGPGNRVIVDGCGLRWTAFGKPAATTPPGPRIGRLTLEHPPGDHLGYLIAGYAPCP